MSDQPTPCGSVLQEDGYKVKCQLPKDHEGPHGAAPSSLASTEAPTPALSPRELDAALAERLGIKPVNTAYAKGKPDHDYELSTTGDGMLKVLEAMREKSRSVRLHWNDVGNMWVAWFSDRPWAPQASGDLYADEVTADTLPRTVSLAALQALEAEASTG